MAAPLVWPLVATDKASPAFLRLAGAMDKTAVAGTKAEAQMARMQKGMATAGSSLTKHVTLPIVALGAVAISQASKFQQATNVYVTAAGESAKNLKIVQAGIKNVAVQTGTSIDNLTSAQYLIEKAGYRGATGLKILTASAKGAREENAQLSDVVQAMTSVMASYHLRASQSVQVMNALKTGAGQAKVTMEDFAGALSTVIPIASANKISLQQVFGAFATLTQHGTNAKEATQELAATIRSLAAPNRVAMTQMQQLGLSVNDVTSNLGKRGLTGTINLLVGTITSHMGKAGLVIQNAFNQSKSAGQDVQVMLAKMPDQVKALADQYMKGSISLGQWKASLKDLPAPQAALAKQFQTLADKARGFNQLLRTGDPAAQTFVSALKKMAGGSIGLNTILQLSGENMAGFKDRTVAVGKSLHDTSTEVEGWASTSKLASVQADQLKEKLQVLAINAGTALIPVFTKIVSGLSGVVDWFTKLSGTQKAMLGWSVGIMAAMGPILSLGSRLIGVGSAIGRFAVGMSSSMTAMANTSFTTSVRVNMAMRGIASALGGVAIGAAVGSLTQNASTATKSIGVLGSALAGAAMGWGASGGNPIGAVIGGLAGGLTSLATAFFGAGSAAKQSVQPTDDYTNAILADNDAVGKNTATLAANELQHKGLFDAALRLGIGQKTLLQATMGNAAAQSRVTAVLQAQGLAAASAYVHHRQLTQAQKDENSAAIKLNGGLAFMAQTLKVNQHAADNVSSALGKTKNASDGLNKSVGQKKTANVDTKPALVNLSGLDMNWAKVAGNLTTAKSIHLDSTQALNEIAVVQKAISNINGTVVLHTTYAGGAASTVKAKLAGGGIIDGPGNGTSDTAGVFALSKGEAVIPQKAVSRYRPLIDALIHAGRGMASGGHVSAAQKQQNMYSTVSTAVGNIGSLPSPKFTLGKLGDYKIVMAQIAHGWAVLSKEIAHGLSKSAAAHYRKLLREYTREAKQQLMTLERQVLSAPLQKQLTQVDTKLANAQQRLASIKQNRSQLASSVSGAISGTFDVTTAGQSAQVYTDRPPAAITGSSILAQLTKAANQAKRFGRVLRKLRKDKLPQSLLMQLAQAGPAALPQALALQNADPKTFAEIKSEYATLTSSSNATGNFIGGVKYGAAQGTAQGVVDGLVKNKKKIVNRLKEIAHEGFADLGKDIGKMHHHGGKGDVHHHNTTHNYNISGPDADAVAASVERRQRHRDRMKSKV